MLHATFLSVVPNRSCGTPCQPCKKKEPGTPRNVWFRGVGTRINFYLNQKPRKAGTLVKWQFLLKWCKNAGYSKVSAKTMCAPATRGLQSQAVLVSAQCIESCEQSPSSGRRALRGACFRGLQNKHFWLRGCGRHCIFVFIFIYIYLFI